MDPYTRVPRKLKKKWQARDNFLLVLGWFVLIVVFLYGVSKFAQHYSGDYRWPQ